MTENDQLCLTCPLRDCRPSSARCPIVRKQNAARIRRENEARKKSEALAKARDQRRPFQMLLRYEMRGIPIKVERLRRKAALESLTPTVDLEAQRRAQEAMNIYLEAIGRRG